MKSNPIQIFEASVGLAELCLSLGYICFLGRVLAAKAKFQAQACRKDANIGIEVP